jgi:hypothetical protein
MLSFYVHYLCLIGRIYVFSVGHVDKSSLYETLFHCNILSKHHHHHQAASVFPNKAGPYLEDKLLRTSKEWDKHTPGVFGSPTPL